jgi:hypothetical protein
MVTHSSTSRPVQCLCMAERTGCPVLTDLWSYVFILVVFNTIFIFTTGEQANRRQSRPVRPSLPPQPHSLTWNLSSSPAHQNPPIRAPTMSSSSAHNFFRNRVLTQKPLQTLPRPRNNPKQRSGGMSIGCRRRWGDIEVRCWDLEGLFGCWSGYDDTV